MDKEHLTLALAKLEELKVEINEIISILATYYGNGNGTEKRDKAYDPDEYLREWINTPKDKK